MKISLRPLSFQMMISELDVTRKRSRTPFSKRDQSHTNFDLCVCGRVRVQSHALNDKA